MPIDFETHTGPVAQVDEAEAYEVLSAYVETAEWVAGDFGMGADDVEDAHVDVWDFVSYIDTLGIDWREYWSPRQLGHDFFLTRNHHGAGFWDRSYGRTPETGIGEALTEAAYSYGETNYQNELEYFDSEYDSSPLD